ncbi:MAG: hypothetical protein ABIQ41_01890, partial [Gemmatimonadales bacterium]
PQLKRQTLGRTGRAVMHRTILATIVASALLACGDEPTLLDSLRDTPTALVVASDTIRIAAFANRDFQPGSEPGGDSLDASVTTLGTTLPLAVTQMWVVQGEDVWRAAPDSIGAGEWVAHGGPKWAPGTEVYIVAALAVSGAPPVRMRSQIITISQSF